MKYVKNGKVYNTETAEHVLSWDNGYPCNDFNWCEIDIYRTPKGAWFITGKGGPMSMWSRSCGNMTSGGSGFRVWTEDKAKCFLQDELSADEYLKYFPADEA